MLGIRSQNFQNEQLETVKVDGRGDSHHVRRCGTSRRLPRENVIELLFHGRTQETSLSPSGDC